MGIFLAYRFSTRSTYEELFCRKDISTGGSSQTYFFASNIHWLYVSNNLIYCV